MNTLLFFRSIKFIVLTFFLFSFSCNTTKKGKNDDIGSQLNHFGYDDRVENIFKYIQKSKFNIPDSSCNNIIILQTNLCNSCNKETMDAVLDSLKKDDSSVYFILADNNAEIKNRVLKLGNKATILIDTMRLLPKYNLSFLKNVKINTCNNKIMQWSFLQ
jgi:hypothetical protein